MVTVTTTTITTTAATGDHREKQGQQSGREGVQTGGDVHRAQMARLTCSKSASADLSCPPCVLAAGMPRRTRSAFEDQQAIWPCMVAFVKVCAQCHRLPAAAACRACRKQLATRKTGGVVDSVQPPHQCRCCAHTSAGPLHSQHSVNAKLCPLHTLLSTRAPVLLLPLHCRALAARPDSEAGPKAFLGVLSSVE